MYAIYIFRKARLLAKVEMVNDASNPTVDETDVLTQRMQKMIKFQEKMLTNASVNIKNAQTRYKKDYDKKRSLTEVWYIIKYSRGYSMKLPF